VQSPTVQYISASYECILQIDGKHRKNKPLRFWWQSDLYSMHSVLELDLGILLEILGLVLHIPMNWHAHCISQVAAQFSGHSLRFLIACS